MATDTLVYRLALSVTAFQLGVDHARQALLQASLDGRANAEDLRRAVVEALAALDDAEANRLSELTAADLLDAPPPPTALSGGERVHPDQTLAR